MMGNMDYWTKDKFVVENWERINGEQIVAGQTVVVEGVGGGSTIEVRQYVSQVDGYTAVEGFIPVRWFVQKGK